MKYFRLLALRFQEFSQMIDLASPGIYSRNEKYLLFMDFLRQRIFNGTFMIDYVQYRFYERNRRGRRRFVEYQRRHEIMRLCNAPEKDPLFDVKTSFNETFAAFMGREWLTTENLSLEDFESFFRKHGRIFVKPQIGSFGHGVSFYEMQDNTDVASIYETIMATPSLIEEFIEQEASFAAFNSSSLNSVRIVTLVTRQGEPLVMAAVLRTGRIGKIADNFHHHGIASQIDIDTGIVVTRGVDRDFQRYTLHPDSKIPLCGFQVPHWDRMTEFAKRLALVVPETRFVGWDIALNRDGQPVCIEGNRGADLDVAQTTDLIGKYHMFKRLI